MRAGDPQWSPWLARGPLGRSAAGHPGNHLGEPPGNSPGDPPGGTPWAPPQGDPLTVSASSVLKEGCICNCICAITKNFLWARGTPQWTPRGIPRLGGPPKEPSEGPPAPPGGGGGGGLAGPPGGPPGGPPHGVCITYICRLGERSVSVSALVSVRLVRMSWPRVLL